MSCTPSLMPADEIAGRNRGRIALLMMMLEMASVSDRLKAAADLDAHLALIRRDDEEDAVVSLLGADAPMAAELIAVILDGSSPAATAA